MNSPATVAENPDRWNFLQLGAALFIGCVLQSLVLPCLCSVGTAKISFAYCFDVLVLLRMLIARFRLETGKGWLVYAVLCYTSAGWIEGITYLVLGQT